MQTDAHNNEYFLPADYSENKYISRDENEDGFWPEEITKRQLQWQVPVYRLARQIAQSNGVNTVLDVGCGSGHKLVQHLGSTATRLIGLDQESGIRTARKLFPEIISISGDFGGTGIWAAAQKYTADLVICADVIEHVREPIQFLRKIRNLLSEKSILVLSSPDRERLENCPVLGPPRNPRHVREWTAIEMTKLLRANGFEIIDLKHLFPSSHDLSLYELARQACRLAQRKALPDQKSCMAFVLRKSLDFDREEMKTP